MSPRERALLLQHGVTLPVIEGLEEAGHGTLSALAELSQRPDELAAVPEVGVRGAWAVRRAIGRLADVGLAEARGGGRG